jgi:hypothetical protein
MGFTVNLYTFSKKINSTARPSSAAASYSCIIKEQSSILNPVIGLSLGLVSNPSSYNYAYIPTYNRYYFIKDWTFNNALWYATMEVDVLASWKDTIGASTCYVLRNSGVYDLNVVDTTYPTTYVTTTLDSQQDTFWNTDGLANGMFVVGVGGQSTTYYLFTKDALDLFFSWMFSDLYADALVGDWATIFPQVKAQCNPLQYITSIMWVPFQIFTYTQVDTIRVGWVDVPCVAFLVEGTGMVDGMHTFTIIKHPQAPTRGNYLNLNPYTNYTFFYPPWGMIRLDAEIMANNTTLNVIWNMDLRTGTGTLTLATADTHILSWSHTQVGVNYQVSQVVNKGFGIGNVLAPLVTAAGGLLSGNYAGAAGAAITGGVGAIGDAVSSKVPSMTTIGSSGGTDALRGKATLQYEFKTIVEEDLNHRGRPLCQNKQINTLAGYIVVSDADISLPATEMEQAAVRKNMEGGFYYE